MNRYRSAQSWRVLIGTLWDRTRVYVVDGYYVRTNLRNSQFWGGGHGYEDASIPKDEIWVERARVGGEDTGPIGTHEIIEYIFMKYCGLSYNEAHDRANSGERIERDLLKTTSRIRRYVRMARRAIAEGR